jgi:hypothetical protein
MSYSRLLLCPDSSLDYRKPFNFGQLYRTGERNYCSASKKLLIVLLLEHLAVATTPEGFLTQQPWYNSKLQFSFRHCCTLQ